MTEVPYVPISEVDETLNWCVLFLQAGQRFDEATMGLLLERSPAPVEYVPALVGIANKLGYMCHGRERFAELVGSWVPGAGIPGVHRPPFPYTTAEIPSTPATRAARVSAAVGIVTAVMQTEGATEGEFDQLTTIAAQLLPDLYGEGLGAAAVAFARIAEAAIRRAAHAEGLPIDELWHDLAARINAQLGRGE